MWSRISTTGRAAGLLLRFVTSMRGLRRTVPHLRRGPEPSRSILDRNGARRVSFIRAPARLFARSFAPAPGIPLAGGCTRRGGRG